MRIQLSDPSLLLDLRQHFERASFTVKQTSNDEIEVRRADAPDEEQARREIELHLRVWQAMNPPARE